jgi:hypothetical protein
MSYSLQLHEKTRHLFDVTLVLFWGSLENLGLGVWARVGVGVAQVETKVPGDQASKRLAYK